MFFIPLNMYLTSFKPLTLKRKQASCEGTFRVVPPHGTVRSKAWNEPFQSLEYPRKCRLLDPYLLSEPAQSDFVMPDITNITNITRQLADYQRV